MRPSFVLRVMLTASALVGARGISFAQTQAPRDGNIWGRLDHKPVPSLVRRNEAVADVAPKPQQQQATADEVESLYESLMRAESSGQSSLSGC
jgi:hypothetical protein